MKSFTKKGIVLSLIVLSLTLAAVAAAETLQFKLLSPNVIEQRLNAFTKKNATREPAMRSLFEEAGCKSDALSEQTVKGVKAPNLICKFEGQTTSEIVVGAHFDFVERGDGVVDNWSGASLLPSLYEGLASQPRKHTFVFVAFTGEEIGELGSRAFVKQLGDEKWLVRAMVNMDTLGLGETKVWLSHSDQTLANMLALIAQQMKLPLGAVNVEKVGSTDSESFRDAKIPAITIHSLTQDTLRILHSPQDKIEAIRMDDYIQTYRLVLAYLAFLDQKVE